ncbi:MAG: hypothetical protein KIH08_13475 [Candidatus Freyarchaeota archaeon]|nr:hypothetical protein [Candidatus Jordarchaeia archaeon]MBS7270047.1 hypothetical protein [Candidatus Jordarchaeia archaeon]MBS7280487.1 hypothetical protein [Candidatus Jordarchaeia archaeon]
MVKIWSDSRLNQAAKTCLNHIQSFLGEKGIHIEILNRPKYRFYVADLPYFQSYFGRMGYSQQTAETLAEITNAITIHGEKIIVLKEKYIQNYDTILHELLHSLTWIKTRYKRWIREGLTRYIQKLVSSHSNIEIGESIYDEFSYTKMWENAARVVGEKTILLLYFSESEEALRKTTKNFEKAGINLPELLEMNFNQAKSLLSKKPT